MEIEARQKIQNALSLGKALAILIVNDISRALQQNLALQGM